MIIGWDIGGANLKMAGIGVDGKIMQVEQHATPLWQGLDCLRSALSNIKTRLNDSGREHVVTTTGELADIFKNRKQGVETLLQVFCEAFISEPVRVYAGKAGMLPVASAGNQYQDVASANWHATAAYVANCYADGILLDIGSTTTDVIPFSGGRLCNRGYSDRERMCYDELLYTGIIRTPLMSVVSRVPFGGEWQSLAAEHFATTADIYRVTGDLDESHDLMPAADGGGKRLLDSVRRVARMLGQDVADNDPIDRYRDLCRYIAEEHLQRIHQALQRVKSVSSFPSQFKLVGAGTGRFLAAMLAQRHGYAYSDFGALFGAVGTQQVNAADCAAAVSVAQLMRLCR